MLLSARRNHIGTLAARCGVGEATRRQRAGQKISTAEADWPEPPGQALTLDGNYD